MAEHKHTKKARALLVRAGYKAGGSLRHPDEAEDKKLIGKAFKEHDAQLHGGKRTKLKLSDGGCAMGGEPRARGDRKPRGKHGHKTVVNVVVGRGAPDKQPVPVPVPVPPPGAGPVLAGGPPVPPPGMVPPGPLGQKHGGRSFKKGGKVDSMRSKIKGLPDGRLKRGGRAKAAVPMTAGAGGGEGRLQKIKDYGAKA